MKTAIRLIALVILLALMTFLVPAGVPLALGEEDLSLYPVYEPVTLTATGSDLFPLDFSDGTPYAPHEEDYLPDGSGYLDSTISVRVETMTAYNCECWLVWVQIADPSQIRTELCKPYPSKATARTDKLAARVNSVLAMNGDYFVYHSQGFVVRNGETLREHYNDDYDTLIIDDKGDLTIIPHTTKEAVEAFEGNIVQAFTFGPGLVIDGVLTTEFPLKANTPTKKTQRICLAQMDTLSYLIVATESPDNGGGMTLKNFAQLVYDLGAVNAYNLDGGSSSSIVLNGEKVNSSKKYRAIGDIIYFVTGEP